jgi:hypothetical protein
VTLRLTSLAIEMKRRLRKKHHNYYPSSGHSLVLAFEINSKFPHFLNDEEFKVAQEEEPNISQDTRITKFHTYNSTAKTISNTTFRASRSPRSTFHNKLIPNSKNN